MILIWILAIILIGFSLCTVLVNLWVAFGGLIKKRTSFVSYVPFVGGIVGAIGLFLLPVSQTKQFWWVPLVIDIGCGHMLVAVIIDQIKKKLRQ